MCGVGGPTGSKTLLLGRDVTVRLNSKHLMADEGPRTPGKVRCRTRRRDGFQGGTLCMYSNTKSRCQRGRPREWDGVGIESAQLGYRRG